MMPERSKAGSGWFGRPVLSGLIAACWLMLQRSADPANLIAAAVLALILPRAVGALIGAAFPVRSAGAAVRLTGRVVWDIVLSNIAVAKIALNPFRVPCPAWVAVPLDITHPNGIALFASIITMTPGTVSCVIDEHRREILVHALDCDDPDGAARDMKARYEQPLREIFG